MSPVVLPEPLDEHLGDSPLKLVVCQVRHESSFSVGDAGLAVTAHERLADRYPELAPFHQQELVVTAGPGGANASQRQPQPGWQLKSADQRWTVTFQIEYFSIETSAYEDWEDFRSRFEEVLTVVSDLYSPKLEQRIGLRYVDELVRENLESPSSWVGLIDESVVGPLSDPQLGPAIRAIQQLFELEATDHMRVIVRHGCEPLADGKGTVYRLDHDCYRQRGRAFENGAIMEALGALHRLALQVFQKSITETLYAELKT